MTRDEIRTLAEEARAAIAAHAALNEDEPAERRAYARKEAALEALHAALTPDAVLTLLGPDAPLAPASPDTAPVGEAWRPIETAPKDGTVVNVWLGDADKSDCEFYCVPGTAFSSGWAWDAPTGKWRPCAGMCVPTFVVPTHWQPLPPPPGTTLDPATCRAQGHGRVACERCGAEYVDVASVRQGQAVGRG